MRHAGGDVPAASLNQFLECCSPSLLVLQGIHLQRHLYGTRPVTAGKIRAIDISWPHSMSTGWPIDFWLVTRRG